MITIKILEFFAILSEKERMGEGSIYCLERLFYPRLECIIIII